MIRQLKILAVTLTIFKKIFIVTLTILTLSKDRLEVYTSTYEINKSQR